MQQCVAACEVYQQNKYQNLCPVGLFTAPASTHICLVRHTYGFCGRSSRGTSEDSIKTVVDRLTKYADLLPLSHPFTAPLN